MLLILSDNHLGLTIAQETKGILSSIKTAVRCMPELSVGSYEPHNVSVGRILTDHRAPQVSPSGLSWESS